MTIIATDDFETMKQELVLLRKKNKSLVAMVVQFRCRLSDLEARKNEK